MELVGKVRFAEIITIGNEILDGRVVDTNRVFIGKALRELGIEVRHAQSVDDDLERVIEAFKLANARSDLVICTGGLGPTSDDLTAEAFAKFANRHLETNDTAKTQVEASLLKRGRVANSSQLKQAKLPQGSEIIFNPVGTAPGFYFSLKATFAFFPGVPGELYPMFGSFIEKNIQPAPLQRYTWNTIFTAEGDLQESLNDISNDLAPFKLGYRTQFPENFVSLIGSPQSDEQKKRWDLLIGKINSVLEKDSFLVENEITFEESVLLKLQAQNARLILVESCTGGLISHLLTDVPGCSNVLWGAHVTYANDEKVRLGVDREIIEKHGAVSEECARAMAVAGLKSLKQDCVKNVKFLVSLSTTGIAGPGGATPTKPVGLCFMAVSIEELGSGRSKTVVEKLVAPSHFERRKMKLFMAKKALNFLRTTDALPINKV